VGLYAAVANANHMAAWGGADLLLGTNPLAIAVPTGGAPLVFDMATSIVAYGTVKKYALRGLRMPEGWFVDAATGTTITDPAKSAAGVLQPMGEYKGSGLALMIGLVAGVLNGGASGRDVADFTAADDSSTNAGHAIVAVDIARLAVHRRSGIVADAASVKVPVQPRTISCCAAPGKQALVYRSSSMLRPGTFALTL